MVFINAKARFRMMVFRKVKKRLRNRKFTETLSNCEIDRQVDLDLNRQVNLGEKIQRR